MRSTACALALLASGASTANGGTLGVAELQELEELLASLGFDPGTRDGIVDDRTTEAIRQYYDFAYIVGEPEPSAMLLAELRGVAEAVGSASQVDLSPAPALEPEPAAAPEPAPLPEPEIAPDPAPEIAAPPAPPAPQPEIPDSANLDQPEIASEPGPEPLQHAEAPTQTEAEPALPTEPLSDEAIELELEAPAVTEAPPIEPNIETPAPDVAAADEQTAALAPAVSDSETDEEEIPTPPSPEELLQAEVDEALAPHQGSLASGELSHQDLARSFNESGRGHQRSGAYDQAIVDFSVAIHLQPKFAAAYHNRGYAYQGKGDGERANADFEKAYEMGFKRLSFGSE